MRFESEIDSSINHVEKHLDGFIESRYVRRQQHYFSGYLSSHNGCNKSCRFCHLTQTGQTDMNEVNLGEFISQSKSILNEYKNSDFPASLVHWNFMARGEPLENNLILNDSKCLFDYLESLARHDYKLYSKFNISTIMPDSIRGKSLVDIFHSVYPTIYYSIYSANQGFRKRWIPKAIDVRESLQMLKEYQDFSKKIIKFHCAFIEDQNDYHEDIIYMMSLIKDMKILGEFNIVRYNPASEKQGTETQYLEGIKEVIGEYMPVKIIQRVGSDVAASCGTFYPI